MCEYGTTVKFRPITTSIQEPAKRKTLSEPLTVNVGVSTFMVPCFRSRVSLISRRVDRAAQTLPSTLAPASLPLRAM